MKQINSYLTFSGNCVEAMNFYKDCLGGELEIQKVEGSPMAEHMPERMRQSVLHSTLTNGNVVLMASDMVSEKGLLKGNSVSLMLNCASEDEVRKTFDKLASGGSIDHPLENTFWGALFGDLTDKFGNHWLLHYQKDGMN
jgi:PhnB protein